MFREYSVQLFLLAVFFMIVYAVVEVIKNGFQALPDSWGKWCSEGIGSKGIRWISFIVAYVLSWLFDFQFATLVFNTINKDTGKLPIHANYFIVACLLFCGSRWIFEQINSNYKSLMGDEK